jgi:hypothetical protein
MDGQVFPQLRGSGAQRERGGARGRWQVLAQAPPAPHCTRGGAGGAVSEGANLAFTLESNYTAICGLAWLG